MGMTKCLVGHYSLGETVLSDIPLEPTLPDEQCAQRMSRVRSGNGAACSHTQRRRSEYGEHGEYPPLDKASTLLFFMTAPGEGWWIEGVEGVFHRGSWCSCVPSVLCVPNLQLRYIFIIQCIAKKAG